MLKIAVLSLASIATIGVIGITASNVYAQSSQGNKGHAKHNGSHINQKNGEQYGKQKSLDSKAKVLGISADELKKELSAKSLDQIISEKGLSKDTFHEKMKQEVKARMESEGLNSERVQEKLNKMDSNHKNKKAEKQ